MTTDQIWAAVLGLLVTVATGAFAHLYSLQGHMQEKLEESMAEQLRDIWTQIRQLSTDINKDRGESANERVQIAKAMGQMVTRTDLREELSRFLGNPRAGH